MPIVVATYNVHRCVGRDGRSDPERTLAVLLETSAGPLRLIATHLGLRPYERRLQLRHLLALQLEQAPATVLLGDLNEWFLWGRPLRWLRARFGRTPGPPSFPARCKLVQNRTKDTK